MVWGERSFLCSMVWGERSFLCSMVWCERYEHKTIYHIKPWNIKRPLTSNHGT
jgi:hypothetical protein